MLCELMWAFSVPGAASSCPAFQRPDRQKELIASHCICSLLSTGKSKKEDSTKEEKRKRDVPAQLLKSAKPTQGSKSQQVLQTQQPSAPQSQQGGFSAHKEIKLTLLNKVRGGVGAIPSAGGSVEADGMDTGAPGWRKGSSRLRAGGMSSAR